MKRRYDNIINNNKFEKYFVIKIQFKWVMI